MVIDRFNLGRVDYYFYTVGPDRFWIKAYYNEICRVTKYNSIRQLVKEKIKEIKKECMENPEKNKKVIHFIDDYTPAESIEMYYSMEMDYIEEECPTNLLIIREYNNFPLGINEIRELLENILIGNNENIEIFINHIQREKDYINLNSILYELNEIAISLNISKITIGIQISIYSGFNFLKVCTVIGPSQEVIDKIEKLERTEEVEELLKRCK